MDCSIHRLRGYRSYHLLDAAMSNQTELDFVELRQKAQDLLNAIHRRWDGESERKRERAISPAQDDAMQELQAAIDRMTLTRINGANDEPDA